MQIALFLFTTLLWIIPFFSCELCFVFRYLIHNDFVLIWLIFNLCFFCVNFSQLSYILHSKRIRISAVIVDESIICNIKVVIITKLLMMTMMWMAIHMLFHLSFRFSLFLCVIKKSKTDEKVSAEEENERKHKIKHDHRLRNTRYIKLHYKQK